MLKRTVFMAMAGVLVCSQSALAGNASRAGIGGAAGGAIIGQAIGRNTEATLLGTAIGGVLGYMIGNEHDKMRTSTAVYYPAASPPPPAPECREMEMLATMDGRPEHVYATACFNGREWVVQGNGHLSGQTVIIEREIAYPRHQARYRHDPPRYRGGHHGSPAAWGRPGHYQPARFRGCDNTRIIIR
ncbi:glycine zipper 2TM domain-containing protein [Thiovibrio sp. JS02]